MGFHLGLLFLFFDLFQLIFIVVYSGVETDAGSVFLSEFYPDFSKLQNMREIKKLKNTELPLLNKSYRQSQIHSGSV